jgi:hypothetical protein
MKNQPLYTGFKFAVLATVLTIGAGVFATTISTTPTLSNPGVSQGVFQAVAFRDGTEADVLRRAYRILATGDHDYKGHRVRAMHAVEAAGKLLDMDLAGDLKDRTPQPLSDDKLREAQGLITEVLGAAEVKDQKRITKHLHEAVNQINTALSVR